MIKLTIIVIYIIIIVSSFPNRFSWKIIILSSKIIMPFQLPLDMTWFIAINCTSTCYSKLNKTSKLICGEFITYSGLFSGASRNHVDRFWWRITLAITLTIRGRINYQPVDAISEYREIGIFLILIPDDPEVVQRSAALSAPHSSSRGGKICSRLVRASTPWAHDVNNRLLINCLTAQVELTMANLWFVTPPQPRAPRVVALEAASVRPGREEGKERGTTEGWIDVGRGEKGDRFPLGT